jgi:hypothetical protein
MHRKSLSFAIVACMAAAAACAVAGPTALFVVLPLVAAFGGLMAVSASNPDANRRTRNLPHWLTVALYRVECFGYGMRNKLGAALFAFNVRTGAILCAFPSSVTTDIAFGVVGELAFDGPFRSQPARINHGTAADIVVGRWFTLAADGTARPGGAAPAGGHAGVFMNPKNQASLGTAAGGALAPTMTVPTGTIGEFGYMGAFVVQVANAVAIGQAAKYADATGIISAGAPGAGETAIPNSKFIRYANAAAGLAVLEVTI